MVIRRMRSKNGLSPSNKRRGRNVKNELFSFSRSRVERNDRHFEEIQRRIKERRKNHVLPLFQRLSNNEQQKYLLPPLVHFNEEDCMYDESMPRLIPESDQQMSDSFDPFFYIQSLQKRVQKLKNTMQAKQNMNVNGTIDNSLKVELRAVCNTLSMLENEKYEQLSEIEQTFVAKAYSIAGVCSADLDIKDASELYRRSLCHFRGLNGKYCDTTVKIEQDSVMSDSQSTFGNSKEDGSHHQLSINVNDTSDWKYLKSVLNEIKVDASNFGPYSEFIVEIYFRYALLFKQNENDNNAMIIECRKYLLQSLKILFFENSFNFQSIVLGKYYVYTFL